MAKGSRKHAALYRQMVEAARKAVDACVPTPMVVVEAIGLSNTPKPGAVRHYVADGVCGFGWVKIAGNTSFGKWAKAEDHARPDYPSGLSISAYHLDQRINQSLEKAEVAARAAAKVLNDAGIKAYAQSRID